MHCYDYELFVIGAGSGGVRASRMAAQKGVKVGIAEPMFMGGTCVNVGCVPKKLYAYAAQFKESFSDSEGFGWEAVQPQFEWSRLRDNKRKEIDRLNSVYVNILKNSGVDLYPERASFIDAHTLQVGEDVITAERILIATGGWPSVPEVEGKEHILTSNEIFDLDEFPQRIVIVGGGYIAVEFASIFNGLGSQVTLINRGELPLKGFDQDIREFAINEIVNKGVHLQVNTEVNQIKQTESGHYLVELNSGESIETDRVFYATGRTPNTAGLNLDKVGVSTEMGAVVVDERFQTTAESIYAIGDVINRIQLTPVALNEAMALVEFLYGDGDGSFDYSNIATAVFCLPNIATVGFTEDEAVAQGHEVVIFKSDFRSLKNTLSGNSERTLMKMIVDASNDKVLGMHMVGPDAGEIIQGFAAAIKLGVTKPQLDSVVGIHPTSAEEFVTMRTPA